MENKKKNQIQKIIILICLIVILLCLGWLGIDILGKWNSEKEVNNMKDDYITVITDETTTPLPAVDVTQIPENTSEPTVQETPSPYDIQVEDGNADALSRRIDISGLQKEENEDIYAWIYIPGTNVDYPILQHPADPGYYLRRNTQRKSATAGCIYTELYNAKDFSDNMTVIYGHNMRNESMFANLHLFEDDAFFDANPYIYVYTDTEIRIYQVFAANEYSDAHLLLNGDMTDKEQFGKYLDGLHKLNGDKDNFNWEIGVTSEDKIITLSTCVRNENEKRYLVQAKLISIQDVAE